MSNSICNIVMMYLRSWKIKSNEKKDDIDVEYNDDYYKTNSITYNEFVDIDDEDGGPIWF